MKSLPAWFFPAARTGFAAALVYYLASSGLIRWSALRGMAAAWPWIAAALLALAADVLVTAGRLSFLLTPRGFHLPLAASVRLALMATFFNFCLPGGAGGDAVRMYYACAGNPGRRVELGTILVVDRLIGMLGLLIVQLAVAPWFLPTIQNRPALRILLAAALGGTLATLAGLLVAWSGLMRSAAATWVFQKSAVGHYAGIVLETVRSYRRHRSRMLGALALAVVAHLLAFAALLLISRAADARAFGWEVAMVIPFGFLANMLPLTPGGLGVGEAAMDSLFRLVGRTGGAEALLGWRLLMFLLGLAGLVFYVRGRQRFVHQAESGLSADWATVKS